MLDYRNFKELANHLVWLPFHFLPGNGGRAAGEEPPGSFIDKLICRPNSPVAVDMVRAAVEDQDNPWSLHRLGITAHVFVDTWAHQGFAGVTHSVNEVRKIESNGEPDSAMTVRVLDYFKEQFVGTGLVPPLGHGKALSYPDQPYLNWSYVNGRGERIERDNPRDFVEAADELCKMFRRYRLRDADAAVPGLPDADRDRIADRLRGRTDEDGEARHRQWLADIAQGAFSFGPETLTYVPKGVDSRKHRALGTTAAEDGPDAVFDYRPDVLTSDWKLFHDAAKLHKLTVVDRILPRYGIVGA